MLFSSMIIPTEVNSHSTYSTFSCKHTEHVFSRDLKASIPTKTRWRG